MIKVLFICHGNICRSPMAEFVFKDLVCNKGLDDMFEIDSKATSREEIGNDMYPPVKSILKENGIPFERRYARQMTLEDYKYYDYIVGMDQENLYNLMYMTNQDPLGKITLLLDHTSNPREISDPWYNRNFRRTYEEVVEGCNGLFNDIMFDYTHND